MEVRISGKYIIIFERGFGDIPDYGSVRSIQADDVVCFSDENGNQTLVVDKLAGTKWTRKIVTKPVIYYGHTVTKPTIVDPHSIRRVLRLKPGEVHGSAMDD